MSATDQPVQQVEPQTQGAAGPDKPSLVIQFSDGRVLDGLLPSSLNHLQSRLGEFCQQVVHEARTIERNEHVGTGPTEITAAHVGEAWWVCRRRIRRAKHPIAVPIIRILQAFGIAGFGIGGSNLKSTTWGAWVFAICGLVTFIAFAIEVQLQRSE